MIPREGFGEHDGRDLRWARLSVTLGARVLFRDHTRVCRQGFAGYRADRASLWLGELVHSVASVWAASSRRGRDEDVEPIELCRCTAVVAAQHAHIRDADRGEQRHDLVRRVTFTPRS